MDKGKDMAEDPAPPLEVLLKYICRGIDMGMEEKARDHAQALIDACLKAELMENADGKQVFRLEYEDGRRWALTVEPLEPAEND